VFAAARLTASQRDRVRFPVRALVIRTAVRAARTRSSKPASRVRLPGGTRKACVGPAVPHGVARVGTSFIRVAKLATQTAVNRPTAGSNPAPGANETAHAVAKWNGRSPPKAAFAGSNPADGTSSEFWSGTHLGSEAAVYRPRRVRFSSGPLTTPGYPNQIEDAGSDPVCCRCKSCPWYRRARSTTAVHPHDKRPTRGPTPPAPTPGSSGEARWL
jgi:hypothetical protein